MKHLARYGKVWQDKRTDKIYGRELEISTDDNIDNYKMIVEPKNETPSVSRNKKEEKKGMFESA